MIRSNGISLKVPKVSDKSSLGKKSYAEYDVVVSQTVTMNQLNSDSATNITFYHHCST